MAGWSDYLLGTSHQAAARVGQSTLAFVALSVATPTRQTCLRARFTTGPVLPFSITIDFTGQVSFLAPMSAHFGDPET